MQILKMVLEWRKNKEWFKDRENKSLLFFLFFLFLLCLIPFMMHTFTVLKIKIKANNLTHYRYPSDSCAVHCP